jgi:hypothetical protein
LWSQVVVEDAERELPPSPALEEASLPLLEKMARHEEVPVVHKLRVVSAELLTELELRVQLVRF